MGSVPFALSIHHFISTVGADAGFAAIIGLAILVLLYFAQARETATLRDHAYESAQRIQQLEARLAQVGRAPAPSGSQVAPAPPGTRPVASPMSSASVGRTAVVAGTAATAASAAAVAAPRRTKAPVAPASVGAPAGVGAPALSAATKLIPTGGPEPLESGVYDSDEFVPDATVIGAPSPATAAGGANGATQQRTPPPAAAAFAPAASRQVRPGTIPPSGRRPAGPPRGPGSRGGISRPLLVSLIGLGVVAVIVLVFVVAGLGSSSSASHTSSASASQRKTAAVFRPESVTVAVLNGTSVSQLAHHVAARLNQLGYKQGTVATASDQTRTTTVVAYMPDARTDALHVAKSLKLKPASVQAMDPATKAVACPPGQTCAANVIVTVGTDLANTY